MFAGSLGSSCGHYGIHNALLAQTSAASSTTSVADDGGTDENAQAATAPGTAASDTALTGKSKASISNDMLAALTRMQEDPDMQAASDAAPAQNTRGLPGDRAVRKALHAPLDAAIAAQKAQAGVVREDTASLKSLREDYKSAKGDKAARADLQDQIATLKAQKQTDIAAFKADKVTHQSEAAALKAMKQGG